MDFTNIHKLLIVVIIKKVTKLVDGIHGIRSMMKIKSIHKCKILENKVIFCSGGGIFVDSIKIGRWIDLNETFRKICQVIY